MHMALAFIAREKPARDFPVGIDYGINSWRSALEAVLNMWEKSHIENHSPNAVFLSS